MLFCLFDMLLSWGAKHVVHRQISRQGACNSAGEIQSLQHATLALKCKDYQPAIIMQRVVSVSSMTAGP